MELRVVSIKEISSADLDGRLELKLEDLHSVGTMNAGVYKPRVRLIAYVPNSGEFHGLTIGKVLQFGDEEFRRTGWKTYPWPACTGTGDFGLPPSGLASEAFEPNERAAVQAVLNDLEKHGSEPLAEEETAEEHLDRKSRGKCP